MKQIDAGGLSFRENRRRNKYYVDKTLLIKDILESNDSGVFLFTRPRRFGKTTNLTMMDAFFNIDYKGNDWFDGLAISRYPEYDGYKNAFPVINLNMKDTKSPDYENFMNALGGAIVDALKKHPYLIDSPILMKDEKILIDALLTGNADRDQLKTSLRKISEILERHHGKKVVILIDEYDIAVSDSFGEESHRPIMDLLGGFIGAAVKNNDSLQMAYITGVMQIAKESLFSDLNNVKVNNIFSKASDERFGFTEGEVKDFLSYYGHPEKFEEAKEWYDGYRFGDAEIYNPWSIINYVSDGFTPRPYWVDSGGDGVVRWLLERIDDRNFSDIMGLVDLGTVRVRMKEALVFSKLDTSEVSIYSLMAMSGYLKATYAGDGMYDISIPNMEVAGMVEGLLSTITPVSDGLFDDFNRAVLEGDADRMTDILQDILLNGSCMNLEKEYAYELILMTVMHSLTRRYDMKTECESGNGRTDIIMRPRDGGTVPMIFELKRSASEKDLEADADGAISQIHERKYYMGMKGRVVLFGISFWVKVPKVKVEIVEI